MKIATEHEIGAGEVFETAFRLAREQDDSRVRIDSFRNQYGYCRNMAFVFLLGALAVAGLYLSQANGSADWMWGAGFLFLALMLFLRFLKFLRLFKREVLLAAIGGGQ